MFGAGRLFGWVMCPLQICDSVFSLDPNGRRKECIQKKKIELVQYKYQDFKNGLLLQLEVNIVSCIFS